MKFPQKICQIIVANKRKKEIFHVLQDVLFQKIEKTSKGYK